MTATVPRPARRAASRPVIDLGPDLREILHRHPAVGLAVTVLRDGAVEHHLHGLADLGTGESVEADTVFRIGSVTKTMTAIAVMQLVERGLVDLDAPATEVLRSFRLTSARPAYRPATPRHLLTHTAGIPEVVRLRDLFHPTWGPFFARPALLSVEPGAPMPSLADYYRGGLRVVAEPGSTFAYSNHGFATLGQIVEDVTGLPMDRYLREAVFDPLGMTDSHLLRSERVRTRLATAYAFGRRGALPVPDREWIGAAGGGVYSTPSDMARYAAALLNGGANEDGRVLAPETLASMMAPHYRTGTRLPMLGLSFFLTRAAGYRLVAHDGILPGFHATMVLAPDVGAGVVLLTNGSPGAMAWMPAEARRLVLRVLGATEPVPPSDVPHRPELWPSLCGRYVLPPVADLRGRLGMGGGLEVLVRGGQLTLRVRAPLPALLRGVPLEPDDADDPLAFRAVLPALGVGILRLAFEPGTDGRAAAAIHTDLGGQPISFVRRPDAGRVRGVVAAGALAAAAGLVAARAGRRGPPGNREP